MTKLQRIPTILLLSIVWLACGSASAEEKEIPIRPALPPYAVDDFGPLPFPEEVTGFILHELRYLLRRQNKDGSWNSAQPMGYGKTSMEAGGTVDKITLTSMCGFSLRKYPEYLPEGADARVDGARDYVSRSIKSGTLKVNVQDAPWRYVYALRFLADEYARATNTDSDAEVQADLLESCTFIIRALERMQFRTRDVPLKHLDDERLPKETIWVARDADTAGGWGYLTKVKGSSTFLSADALREILFAKEKVPELAIPDALLSGPFFMLSKLRKVQPNTETASYRYDAAGSFWGEKDIRADVGRIAGAELACLLYAEREQVEPELQRTHAHLEKALQAWLDHRTILDRVKFPSGHGTLSIAPWFWVYSYRTTLEAAAHLNSNPVLQAEVQESALRGIFKHMVYRHEAKLGEKGWIIGGDLTKELHDSCQLLDGLATMKHVFGGPVSFTSPELRDAAEAFRETRYGDAVMEVRKATSAGQKNAELNREANRMMDAVDNRFNQRLAEVKDIYKQYPYDGLAFLEAMPTRFAGCSGMDAVKMLTTEWKAELPERPPWHVLGDYPVNKTEGLSDVAAWGKIFSAADASGLDKVDPSAHAIRGTWRKIAGQLLMSSTPNARIQLPLVPEGSYTFETQFTRINGDCMAVMFPVGNTSGLLVVSGWGGKVSGLAYLNGKDANRNPTTRDGALSNGEMHTVRLEVQLKTEADVVIRVLLDGKDYLAWEGPIAALRPDREWKLRDNRALGLGGYNAQILIHSVRLQTR